MEEVEENASKKQKKSFDLDTVKIKQEKITPPPSPSKNQDALTDSLLDSILGERKPSAEPIKSSNEILADLFKVLNAAPPTLSESDGPSKKHKKKHKKEKKVKKSKHRKRDKSGSDEEVGDESSLLQSGSDHDEKHKSKLKKVKKEKKREKRKSTDNEDANAKSHKRHKKPKDTERNHEICDIAIKKEKDDERLDGGSSKVDSECVDKPTNKESEATKSKSGNNLAGITVQIETSAKDDTIAGRRKIVIKNLANSTVYHDTIKEVDAMQREKDKKKERDRDRRKARGRTRDRSHSSSLSLSDEETYLRERYNVANYDESRDRSKDRDDFYGDDKYKTREYDRDRKRDQTRHRDYLHEDRGFRSSYRHEYDRR